MSTHQSIVNLLESLGYTRTSGCCHGISLRWLEACLLGEERLFNCRIDVIDNVGVALIPLINAAKEKKGNHLTSKDKALLDILAFYDSLELYQSPQVHRALFNAPLMQGDVEIISNFASSGLIQSRGGLVQIYSEPCIYTRQEIRAYLDDLGVAIEKASTPSKEPLGIVLLSHNHTIALTYTPGKGWKLMDINQYPAKSFMINNTKSLAKRIMTAFNESNSPFSAFNVSVFTTGNRLGLLNLKEAFEPFKKSHRLTKNIAGREAEGIGLARIAAQNNHADVIAELANHGVDLNKADIEGVTPAFIAAEFGHASVIAELAKHKVDLNQVDKDGVTLAYIAAANGHASVIAELAKHKVVLNQPLNNGATPAIIAAQQGHASVIAELAKHGVDLSKANLYGITPAIIAAQQGHASVIAELARCGVDLNQADKNEITPAYIAAQNGHASVIVELEKHNVDLNQAIIYGVTPAYIAAQNGHASVIAELIKVGVNFDAPYTASVDSLRQLAISYGDKVIERMNDFIVQQLVLSPTRQTISMTPYHIAVVMGHSEVIQLLYNNQEHAQKERRNASLQPMEQTQSANDKTIGDGYSFFSFLVKEDVTSNGVNSQPQQVLFDVNQAEPRKRKVKMLDDQSLEEIENKRTRYR